MSIVLMSIMAALCVGVFFYIVSLFGKKEDFMLDDYTEDDKPDNVRIIEREITKIIEKEVIKEVEVEVENTFEIEKLNKEIEEKTFSNKLEIDSTLNKIISIESEFESYRKDMENKLKDSLRIVEELSHNNASNQNENTLIKKSMIDQQSDHIDLIDKLKMDNSEMESKMIELQKFNEEERILIKSKEDELNKERESFNKILEDRDYFIRLVEKKEKELNSIKHDLNYEYQKHPNVYEGIDEYGKFYDISNIDGKFPKDHITKILDVSSKIDSDQFAYYGIQTLNGYENVEIHSISRLSSFIERVHIKRTEGLYKIYIILDNRVYYYEIH